MCSFFGDDSLSFSTAFRFIAIVGITTSRVSTCGGLERRKLKLAIMEPTLIFVPRFRAPRSRASNPRQKLWLFCSRFFCQLQDRKDSLPLTTCSSLTQPSPYHFSRATLPNLSRQCLTTAAATHTMNMSMLTHGINHERSAQLWRMLFYVAEASNMS